MSVKAVREGERRWCTAAFSYPTMDMDMVVFIAVRYGNRLHRSLT